MPAEHRYSPTGTQRSWFVPQGGFADYTAPTTSEVTAGTEIGYSCPNALHVPRSATPMDVSDPSSRQDKQQNATRGGESWTVNVYQELPDGDPAAYENLVEDVQGFIVIFRQGLAGADPADDDVATVVPIVVGSVADVDSGRTEPDRAAVTMFITDDIVRDVALIT